MENEHRRARPADKLSDESVALDRSLEEASASIESARALLSLRKNVGRSLRVAIRCLLVAQEKIELKGPSPAARLDLLEAIRLIGVVEQALKGPAPNGLVHSGMGEPDMNPDNRRAYQRLPANCTIELEPEQRTNRSDLVTLPLEGMIVNVSKGGMLAKIDQGILRHGRYLVRFLEVGGAIKPSVTWGAVRRSRTRSRGWEVGIEFDDPLDEIK